MKYSIQLITSLALAAVAVLASGEEVSYYHHDLTGTPVAATDATGTVIWRKVYRPYGSEFSSTGANSSVLGYTGHRKDEDFGLTYAGARYFDPEIGRFTGRDPAGVAAENMHSFNLYVYGNNNPYRYFDPDGWNAVELVEQLRSGGGPSSGAEVAARMVREGAADVGKAVDREATDPANAILFLPIPRFVAGLLPVRWATRFGVVRFDPKRTSHIFRNSDGHVNPATQASRDRYIRLFEDVASNPANLRADAVEARIITQQAADSGVRAFTSAARNGDQIWVTARDGRIQNAGVNRAGKRR